MLMWSAVETYRAAAYQYRQWLRDGNVARLGKAYCYIDYLCLDRRSERQMKAMRLYNKLRTRIRARLSQIRKEAR